MKAGRNCFALLDDARADGRFSRLYTGYVRSVISTDPARFEADWVEVETELAAGLHAVLLADYEWGVRLAGVESSRPGQGALRVLLFRQRRRCSARLAARWLALREGSATAGACAVRAPMPSVSEEQFTQAVERIHAAITAGETYQVNYSYRLDMQVGGDPLALYRRLRARQPVAYGALIALPPGEALTHVLSFSPELFLRHTGGQLRAQPMKGTAPRHADQAMDLLAREQLATAKSRAENLMIVDLLRNDLGRVARIGSVKVPALFETEAHATVWQMTSTITAELAAGVRFAQLMRALFPCGSITGAPKHRTLQLIDAIETTPRGLYCGALGWVDAVSPRADSADCPDFCLSVPIRTLTLGAASVGWRSARLGIGAGIVADSVAVQERAECELKARFLTGMDSGFALIETLYAEAGVIRHLERHLARQAASAQALGFAPAQVDIVQALRTRAASLLAAGPWRLRLLRYPDGRIELTHALLEPLPAEPVVLFLAEDALDTEAWPLAHKSTVRAPYERALRVAQARGAFDVLHVNPRGELTEGARSNVFLRIDGTWLTPHLDCGLLPGVMRSVLLDDPTWQAREAVLHADDLCRADAVVVCNALRGALSARVVDARYRDE